MEAGLSILFCIPFVLDIFPILLYTNYVLLVYLTFKEAEKMRNGIRTSKTY